jgi:ferredoxin
MKKYKIEHNKPDCIGCGACAAVCPEFWEMEEAHSTIKGSKKRSDGWEELEISERDLECNKEAAESCPVNVIHITDLEKKKKLI